MSIKGCSFNNRSRVYCCSDINTSWVFSSIVSFNLALITSTIKAYVIFVVSLFNVWSYITNTISSIRISETWNFSCISFETNLLLSTWATAVTITWICVITLLSTIYNSISADECTVRNIIFVWVWCATISCFYLAWIISSISWNKVCIISLFIWS